MATFEYSPVLQPRSRRRAGPGSRYELPGDARLRRPRAVVIRVLRGVSLPVGSAPPFQSSYVPPQAVGERDQVPARDPASIPGRTRLRRRGLQFSHRPRLGVNMQQHMRSAAGREGERPRRLDQVEAIEPSPEPLVEIDAGERGQAQRGEELLAELLISEKRDPLLVLHERENIDEHRAGTDELHVEGRGVLQCVPTSQSVGEQIQGQTCRLPQPLKGPFVGIGDEGELLVLRPHGPCADLGRGNASLHDVFRVDLPSLDDACAGMLSEKVRTNEGAKTIRGAIRDPPEDPSRGDEDAPFRIPEGAARPTRGWGDCPHPPERSDRVPKHRLPVFVSCPGRGSSAVASTSAST